jgi:hypothetical protein
MDLSGESYARHNNSMDVGDDVEVFISGKGNSSKNPRAKRRNYDDSDDFIDNIPMLSDADDDTTGCLLYTTDNNLMHDRLT